MSLYLPAQLNRESVLAFIEALMKQKGFNISQLEQSANVSKDTVRDFLRGKTYLIRADKLQKILHVFGYELAITPKQAELFQQ